MSADIPDFYFQYDLRGDKKAIAQFFLENVTASVNDWCVATQQCRDNYRRFALALESTQ